MLCHSPAKGWGIYAVWGKALCGIMTFIARRKGEVDKFFDII
jgi:hypothetical protein